MGYLKQKFLEKNSQSVLIPTSSLKDMTEDIESAELVRSKIAFKDRFVPNVDFSDAENFAKFGSAKQYYIDAISGIWKILFLIANTLEQMGMFLLVMLILLAQLQTSVL